MTYEQNKKICFGHAQNIIDAGLVKELPQILQQAYEMGKTYNREENYRMIESELDYEFEKEWKLLQKSGVKDSSLRHEYEEKVTKLCTLPEKLGAEGKTEEEIARIMHQTRRELGRQYKLAAPPLFCEYIYAATEAKYGDPLGPTFEMLCKKKSYQQIIESASRPIDNLDNRLTLDGFREWYQGRK